MKLEALPYYPWRVIDFRASRKVQRMGYIARGFYRELLDEEWVEGSLPLDLSALAEICGCSRKVMEKAWPELEPCFVETAEGRLINTKLEGMRTAKDAERVKRADAGRLGGLAKQAAASADTKQVLASASTCHIEEKRRGENRNSPAGAGAKVSKTPKDPRHAAFRAVIDGYWKHKNPDAEMPWDGSDAKQLASLLKASPSLAIETFRRMLANRLHSEGVNHAERPRAWIGTVNRYANGPLNRFGQPLEKRLGSAAQTAKYADAATIYDRPEYQHQQPEVIGRPA